MVRSLAKGIAPLLLLVFVFILGRTMAAPVAPTYYLSAGLDPVEIGTLLAAFGLTFLTSEALWGYASGRLANRRTIAVLIIVSALTSLFYTRPQSFSTILLLQPLSAFAFGGVAIFPRIMVSGTVGSQGKGRTFGYLGFVFSGGSVVGSLLGGVTDSFVGVSGTFVAATVVSLASLAALPFIAFSLRSLPSPVDAVPPKADGSELTLRRAELVMLGAIAPAGSMCGAFFGLLLPNILVQTSTFPVGVFEVSVVIATFNVAAGAFQPIMGSLGARAPRYWIVAGLAVCGTTLLLMTQAKGISEIYIITFAAGVANSTLTPLSLLLLSSGIPAAAAGRALGLYGAAEDLGLILGGSVGGFIWAFFGVTWVFLSLSALLFSMSALYFATVRVVSPKST